MDERLFCISNIRSPLLSKAYLSCCCCTASDWLWKSWMSDPEAFFYVYTVYFHTPSPSANMYRFKRAFSVSWGTDDLSKFGWRSGFLFQFSFKAHEPPQVFGLNVLTSSRFNKKTALVLVMQCPTSLCCCHNVSRHILNVTHRSYPNNTVRSVLLS